MVNFKERRRFIRHPICYPLQFEHLCKKIIERSKTINISEGGLLFVCKHRVPVGDTILLKLPLRDKVFKVKAKVVHVEEDKVAKLYNIGVAFWRYSDAFKVKLIEQIYLIDEYRILRSVQLGREVSLKEASQEWISKYSKRFARMYW